jgi:hypothetical protein
MTSTQEAPAHDIGDVMTKLEGLHAMMAAVLARLDKPTERRTGYSVEEVAGMLGRIPYTVREWCRGGRIHATKRAERRGGAELWGGAAEEVARVKDEGLLPPDPARNVGRRA